MMTKEQKIIKAKVGLDRAVRQWMQERVASWPDDELTPSEDRTGKRLFARAAGSVQVLEARSISFHSISETSRNRWPRRLSSWAVERGLIIANPFAGIKAPAAEKARDRILSDDELTTVWRAADTLEPVYAGQSSSF